MPGGKAEGEGAGAGKGPGKGPSIPPCTPDLHFFLVILICTFPTMGCLGSSKLERSTLSGNKSVIGLGSLGQKVNSVACFLTPSTQVAKS